MRIFASIIVFQQFTYVIKLVKKKLSATVHENSADVGSISDLIGILKTQREKTREKIKKTT